MRRRSCVLVFVAVCWSLGAEPSGGHRIDWVQLFLPEITGTETHPDYAGWIPLTGVRFQIEANPSGGKASPVPTCTLQRYVDASSPELALAASSGALFPEAYVDVAIPSPSGRAWLCYRFRFTNIRFLTFHQEGPATEPVRENLEMEFDSVAWTYVSSSSGQIGSWDFPEGDGGLQSIPGNDRDLDGIPDAVDLDVDGDGVGDAFEVRHGYDRFFQKDGSSDLDMDGMTLVEESIAGTDPNEAESVHELVQCRYRSTEVELTWPSVAGRQYFIYGSSSLTDAAWTLVRTVPAADWATETTVTLPSADGFTVYAVEAALP